uniref:SecY-independent transporter protein n=1 Tax=Desmarestia viridis TaxID=62313 RepID=Q2TUG6_9PHAE|nr:SecY-independent protein translocase component tatC [Desmarestia viridis]AAS79031.1 SecY-independent transporter protein [Desmarestia viridis]
MKRLQFSIYYLQEFKYRLAYTTFGTILLFFTTYQYKQALIFIFLPKGLSHFVSTGLTEIFFTYLQLCTILSIGFSLVILLVQLYLFFRPGLYSYEAKATLNLLIGAIIFYSCLYTFIFPALTQLLWKLFSAYSQNFTPIHLTFEPRLHDYLKHLHQLNNILSLSLPAVLGLSLVQMYTNKKIWIKYRGIAYMIAFSISAFLTPPDILSQIMVGLPLIFFYEIQIAVGALYTEYQAQLLIGQPIKTHKDTHRKKEKS